MGLRIGEVPHIADNLHIKSLNRAFKNIPDATAPKTGDVIELSQEAKKLLVQFNSQKAGQAADRLYERIDSGRIDYVPASSLGKFFFGEEDCYVIYLDKRMTFGAVKDYFNIPDGVLKKANNLEGFPGNLDQYMVRSTNEGIPYVVVPAEVLSKSTDISGSVLTQLVNSGKMPQSLAVDLPSMK